jgi:hypothetical protein
MLNATLLFQKFNCNLQLMPGFMLAVTRINGIKLMKKPFVCSMLVSVDIKAVKREIIPTLKLGVPFQCRKLKCKFWRNDAK